MAPSPARPYTAAMSLGKRALIALAALALGGRVLLPYFIESRINRTIAGMKDYQGRVQDVDLALWRGAVSLGPLELWDKEESFRLVVPKAVVDWDWWPLLKTRTVVTEVDVYRPRLLYAVKKSEKPADEAREEAKEAGKEGKALADRLEEMMPFSLDRFQIRDGSIRVREAARESETRVTDVDFVLRDFSNVKNEGKGKTAKAKGSAKIADGTVDLGLAVVPGAKQPTFDADIAVKNVDLRQLNPVLRAQFGVDVQKGWFELFSEVKAVQGRFEGYVKPLVEGVELLDSKQDKGALDVMKEAVIGAAASVLKARETDAVAARAPLKGQFGDPEIGTWAAVRSVLSNAFVEALSPSFERKR